MTNVTGNAYARHTLSRLWPTRANYRRHKPVANPSGVPVLEYSSQFKMLIGSCTHRLQLLWFVPMQSWRCAWLNDSSQLQSQAKPITAHHSIMWHIMTLTCVHCHRPRWLRSAAVVQHELWQCARAAASWPQLSWLESVKVFTITMCGGFNIIMDIFLAIVSTSTVHSVSIHSTLVSSTVRLRAQIDLFFIIRTPYMSTYTECP